MDISRLAPLFQAEGPFASVTLDVSRASETAAQARNLRLRSATEELGRLGADREVIDQVAARLSERVDEPAPVARTVVATAADVQLDELVHQHIDQSIVGWGALPDITGWLELASRNIPFVLALVDHVGGDVAVYRSDVPQALEESSAGGETEFVHKVPSGGWSALRYQHVTENVWSRNAEAVADEVESRIREGNRLILLAGDPRSKGEVARRLETSPATVVELESGSRSEDSGGDALQHAIRQALLEHSVARQQELAHTLQDRLGRGEGAAAGVREVAGAFVRGQVDTLLLDPAAAAGTELRPSDHPGLPLGAVPVDQPVRADQALIAAAALTDAQVVISPQSVLGGAPVAALLRWT
ncbi:MAG TPA: Vms1/Ankzf1 family peptidyl-tRNA hydrolase [Kribbella sp.]|nr:Vms1/Ankzf1 family peptidyl-tRNA hydrolase [Kribbella sp.]